MVVPLVLLVASASGALGYDYDVIVYGSTPAGIAAACVAGREGLKVALYEPLQMIGGMGAAGNLALNDGRTQAEKTGLALNFTLIAGEHYYPGQGRPVTHPESFVSEAAFNTMLSQASVHTVKLDCRLLSAATAQEGGVSRVASVSLHCEPEPVTAAVFIDASYDGEVMVAAGDVDYTWGRESMSQYNESLAGVRKPGFVGVSGPQHVDALREDGSLLKYVQNVSDLGAPGSADDALMAFQHRLCVTTNASNMLPWARLKPAGYEADDFLLHLRALEANHNASLMSLGNHPPGLPPSINKFCTCCGISIAASDQPNLNKGWANATWEQQQRIHAEHTYFELGSYYFLASDPRVPPAVRARYSAYGLCADEFGANGGVPPQLYVRASNRLVGDYVMTQNNMYPQSKADSIAVGDWSLDQHMTNKVAVPVGGGRFEVQLEGNYWPSVGPKGNWYDTPYGIMVPKRGTGANLLVPVAVSSSAVAFSSTRIENWYMSVGSAAGGAAAQVARGAAATVQDVNVTALQGLLAALGQRVHGPPGKPPTPPPTPAAPHAKWFDVSDVRRPSAVQQGG
eukprot:g6902.t1